MPTGQLFVTDDQNNALALLAELEDGAKCEFISQAGNFLINGINRKLISAAAKKLGRDIVDVEACMFAIMKLFTDSARLELSVDVIERSLADHFGDVWLHSGCVNKFCEVYSPLLPSLRQVLMAKSERVSLIDYYDLDWRLEAEIASRFTGNLQPPRARFSMVLQLHNKGTDSNRSVEECFTRHLLETDVSTLAHVTKSLEQALQHGKDRHSRRLAKNL